MIEKSDWLIDWLILTACEAVKQYFMPYGESGPGSNGNEDVFHTP